MTSLSIVDFLFYLFATLAVGGGLAVVFSRNPVTGAMFMILSLVGVASLFALLEAFVLAVLQVLVYAGAVMVLFLFIIMLLDVGPDAGKLAGIGKKRLLGSAAAVLAVGLLTVFTLEYADVAAPPSEGWADVSDEASAKGERIHFSKSVKSFGYGLFTKYVLPLQVAGFLLLAAMVAVIMLSMQRPEEGEDASSPSDEPAADGASDSLDESAAEA